MFTNDTMYAMSGMLLNELRLIDLEQRYEDNKTLGNLMINNTGFSIDEVNRIIPSFSREIYDSENHYDVGIEIGRKELELDDDGKFYEIVLPAFLRIIDEFEKFESASYTCKKLDIIHDGHVIGVGNLLFRIYQNVMGGKDIFHIDSKIVKS